MIELSGMSSDQIKSIYAHLISRNLIKFEIPDEILEAAGIDPKKMNPDQIKAMFAELSKKGLLKPKPDDKKSTDKKPPEKQSEGASRAGRAGLVKKKVTVHRGGKTFEQERWVKVGEEEPVEGPAVVPKPEKPKGPVIQGLNKPEEDAGVEGIPSDKVDTGEPQKDISSINKPISEDEIEEIDSTMKEYLDDLKGDPDNFEIEKQLRSVSDYTNYGYEDINAYLRSDPDIDPDVDIDELNENIDLISAFIKNAPKVKGMVYRGFGWATEEAGNPQEQYDKFMSDMKVGEEVSLKGFASSTTSIDTAVEFANVKDNPVVLEIVSENGVYLNGASYEEREREILFDKGSRFTVKSIDIDKVGITHIVMGENKELSKFEIPDEILEQAGIDPKKMSPDQIKAMFAKLAEKGLLKPKPGDKKPTDKKPAEKQPEGAQGTGRPGLVKKKVTVHRGGKTFQQERWVRAGEEGPVEKPKKVEEKPPEKPKGPVIMGLNKPEDEVEDEKGDFKQFSEADITEATKNIEEYTERLNQTPEGKEALKSVYRYTAYDYVPMNEYLRTGEVTGPNLDAKVVALSNFIKTSPTLAGTVYRGMGWSGEEGESENEFKDFIGEMKVGEPLTLKSFTSTSISKETAFNHAHRKKYTVLYEIDSKNGVFLDGMSQIPGESEVLLNKNSNFDIIDIDKSDPNNIKIKLREITKDLDKGK